MKGAQWVARAVLATAVVALLAAPAGAKRGHFTIDAPRSAEAGSTIRVEVRFRHPQTMSAMTTLDNLVGLVRVNAATKKTGPSRWVGAASVQGYTGISFAPEGGGVWSADVVLPTTPGHYVLMPEPSVVRSAPDPATVPIRVEPRGRRDIET